MKTSLVDENSILIRHDVEPEEIAIWLEVNELLDSKGLKTLFIEAEKICMDKKRDFSLSSMSLVSPLASQVMFKNLFNVLFKCVLPDGDAGTDIAKSLLRHACSRAKKTQKTLKVIKDIARRRSLLNLLEVYCELKDRLEEVLGTAR